MAIREIGYYSAVTTPAVSDEFLCQKNGTSQKTTTTEILDAISDFTQYDKDDLIASGIVMGTQSDAQVKISLAQIIAYAKLIAYGMIYGGYTTSMITNCEAWNVNSEAWTTKEPLNPARCALAAMTISNKGYICGGGDPDSETLYKDCDAYTFGSPGTWTGKTDLLSKKHFLAASTISGKGYVYGGRYDASGSYPKTDDIDEYNATDNTWVHISDLTQARYTLASSTIGDKGYIFGGTAATGIVSTCDRYNPVTTVCDVIKPLLRSRSGHSASTVKNKAYIISGYVKTSSGSTMFSDIDEYDPETDSWIDKSSLGSARVRHAQTTILNTIHITGGYRNTLTLSNAHFYYNPITNSSGYFASGYLTLARSDHAASSLHS